MAGLNVAGSGTPLDPGSPAWFDAMTSAGYTVSPDMPEFVIRDYPPIYGTTGPEPDRPPPVTPTPTPDDLRKRVITPLGPGPLPTVQPTLTPAPSTGGVLSNLNPFDGTVERIRSFLGDAVGAVFSGISTVVSRLTGTVSALAEATLPTIEELATAIASVATGALSFIGDNLTDMADFGATLAGALVEPLYALLDAGGDKVWAFITRILEFLQRAAGGVRQMLVQESALERLI